MDIHKLDPEKARQEAEKKRFLLRHKRRNSQKPHPHTLQKLLRAIFKRRPAA